MRDDFRKGFLENFQRLHGLQRPQGSGASEIAPRVGQAVHELLAHRIAHRPEHDRDRRRDLRCSDRRRRAGGHDDIDALLHELLRKGDKALVLAAGCADVERYVLALDPPAIAQPVDENFPKRVDRRARAKPSDAVDLCALRGEPSRKHRE